MLTNHVFVLNADKTVLNMVNPARARKLLSQKKAAVFRTFPFVIILQNQVINPSLKQYNIKIDPGSKWTGFAIQCGDEIVFRMELEHRGILIKSKLETRANFRRGRRSRNLRYRKKREYHKKQSGWLPPSLMHRVLTTETWIKRFCRYCSVSSIEVEQVRFDMQKIANPEISGIEYQQGTLWGYEVREYLLEKWNRKCAYCNVSNVPLEIEHIKPKSKGGSDRVTNLTLACHQCNQEKGNQDVGVFLDEKYKLDKLQSQSIKDKVISQAVTSFSDASAVNSTRFKIVEIAKKQVEKVNCWSGGMTKMNRCKQQLLKSHSIDAACVGKSGSKIKLLTEQPILVQAKGHGNRQSRRTNDKGFPELITRKDKKTGNKVVQKNSDGSVRTIAPKTVYKHIRTGDIVKFELKRPVRTKGSKKEGVEPKVKIEAGWYSSRVKTPTVKGFEAKINGERVTVSSMNNVRFVHRGDGYEYSFG